MRNTFAVTMTLLLALTLAGSYTGFRLATAEHEEPAKTGSAETANGSVPSPSSSTTGSAGPGTAQGDTTAQNEGGTQAGANGAVVGAGGASSSKSDTVSSATPPAGGAATGGETGQQPAATAAAAQPSGDAKAGVAVFASNCAGCHGAEAKGGIGANLTTADGPKAWTDAQMITALREGKTPQRELNATMPRFTAEQLSDGDITNIHAWLKTLN